MTRSIVLGAVVVSLHAGLALAADPPLIPREVIFGNPERAGVQISPDGRRISFLAARDGVMNVWVAPVSEPARAVPVTNDTTRGIQTYFWAFNNTHILYLKDDGGDENWAVHSVNVESGDDRTLTQTDPILGADGQPIPQPSGRPLRPRAQINGVSDEFPSEIIVGLNNRVPQFHDLYRVNIETGEMALIEQNPGFLGYMLDDEYDLRFAFSMTPDGGNQIFRRTDDGAWDEYLTIPGDDLLTTNPAGFSQDGNTLYLIDSRGRDTAALNALDLTTGELETVFQSPRADVNGMLVHPTRDTIQAVSIDYARTEWTVLDQSIAPDIERLRAMAEGDISISSRSLDDSKWIVVYVQDDGPVRYYLYDRPSRRGTFLFSNRPALEGMTLAKMHPVIIKSRDGLNLVSYLTLPPESDTDADGRPDRPLPAVLYVHGGPWARDSWGYNTIHQWLANRGYAVLSVNYRGSTGFGKNFINAANKEWAGKMHDDLIDAVNWMEAQKIAKPDEVAIMGGSYGGYATLVGLTFTPDTFACGVDIVGPSNLRTLLETVPEYWKPLMDLWAARVGDPRTEQGRAFLDSRSPLSRVDHIKRPLLIGQGQNDPRVKVSESDQIVEEMQRKAIPVTYVLYPDEGHGFARPENRLSFFAVSEAFLAEHIGGRAEPIGDDFTNSSILVPHGAEQVPGVREAIGE